MIWNYIILSTVCVWGHIGAHEIALQGYDRGIYYDSSIEDWNNKIGGETHPEPYCIQTARISESSNAKRNETVYTIWPKGRKFGYPNPGNENILTDPRQDFETDLSSLSVTGWHCVNYSSITYLHPDCHAMWRWYMKPHWTAEVRLAPNCIDETEQHCVLELGYRSDGVVVWRKP